MNQLCHRLVFSRRLGMLVAVAETASAQGKATGSTARRRAGHRPSAPRLVMGAVAVAAATLASLAPAQTTRAPVVFASQVAAPKNKLPVQYGKTFGSDGKLLNTTPRAFAYDPAKGSSATDLSTTGAVTWTVDGKTATFDQGSQQRVVINWDSFDIGAGYKVQFKQDKDPAKYVSALNRIWSADPSVILGSLTADREVILLNANGVYFGRGAVVDTGKFVATANAIADSVFEKGLRNITDGSAVFGSPSNANAAISVEDGAEIRSAAGGDVLLVAPRVVNQGRIDTPQGQAVLAAGDKVYLMSSSDPAQRGLIVAVDPILAADGRTPDTSIGIVENAAKGSTAVSDSTGALVSRINEIRAESGTVNLVGLTVRQNGQINATTAVKGANGAIYLQSMASTVERNAQTGTDPGVYGVTVESGATVRMPERLGTVEIGAGSVTAVRPDTSSSTQIDAEVFNASRIRVEGTSIRVGSGAQVLAPSGRIEMLASASTVDNPLFSSAAIGTGKADGSSIVVAPDAVISAAGIQDVEVDGSRNQGAQRLFRIELADAAVQRASALYRSQMYFDLRDASKVSVANVSGATASLARTAAEKSTAGGSISLLTDGALVLGDNATLDVSGGSVHYGQATLLTSVLSQDGRLVTFTNALRGRVVDAVSGTALAVTTPAYTEGAAGGSLRLSGRQMALAASLKGQTIVGERQRDGRSSLPTLSSLSLGLGSDGSFYLGQMRLQPDAIPMLDAALFSSPAADLPTRLGNALDVSLSQLAQSGFGQVSLRAAQISQPAWGALALPTGGALDIQGNAVQLDGSFSAPGGSIAVAAVLNGSSAAAGDITLSAGSRLDAAGRWTNDTAADSGAGDDIQVKGGSVSVKAAHSLSADAGAQMDVSAGARLSGSGTLTKGSAGSITLASNLSGALDGQLNIGGVQLYGFDFSTGGKLSISGPSLNIGGSAPQGAWSLDARLLSESGFGSITLGALGDIRLVSGTTLAPRLMNWQLDSGYRSAASGDMARVASAQILDATLAERRPVSLSLNSNRVLGAGDAAELQGSSIVVERGAGIVLEPGATLALNASRRISIGAEGGEAGQTSLLQARGGNIQLSLTGVRGDTNGIDNAGFVADQAIWLGNDAALDVSGIAQLRRDSSASAVLQFNGNPANATPADARMTGSVLGGGTIDLTAKRGYVVAEPGARLAMDGQAASLNYTGLAQAVTVARSAGTLNVSSPEGIVLEAQVSARAPRDVAGTALADGGRLNISLGAGGVAQAGSSLATPYPTAARVLAITDTAWALDGAMPGSDLYAILGNGEGRVSTGLLRNAGWSGLSLAAGDRVSFNNALSLQLPLGVQLNAPVIAAAPGVQVALSGGAAQIGDASLARVAAAETTAAAADASADLSTALRISAPTVDVYGNLGLQGFSTVTLDTRHAANGEIRFSAASPSFGRLESLQRALNFEGTLQLVAGQVYATTATQYTLNGGAGSLLEVQRAGSAADLAAPLSVFGSLTINATRIDQGGALRQPFGRLTLNASDTLTLGSGSLTSVSGDGATVLYGQTQNLATWMVDGSPVDSSYLSRFSDKAIQLSAGRFETAGSAVVSARGGGSVLAREFFAGVGGSVDYTSATSGLYAVLPDYAATQSLALAGGIVAASLYGQQITITQAGSGLAAGRYTLLPAQYALMAGSLPQGAFLVSLASDQGKSVLSAPIRQDDGSTIVTGYIGASGSVATGTPGQRFVVEPAATFQAKSDVRLTDVSTLRKANADASGQSVPALPRDAGSVALRASDESGSSLWRARIDLAAVGGRAGTLDASASAVALVDTLDKAPATGLALQADVLSASGAGSVLLGGTRSTIASADCSPVCIDASGTRRTTVDLGGQTLQLEELLLAARDEVSLASGTTLRAAAAGTLGARTLASQGDGVLVAVSANALTLPRAGALLDTGLLTVGAGSTLAGRTVSLDATGATAIDPATTLQATALSLSARHLVLGDAAAAGRSDTLADGSDRANTVLDGDLLTAARSSSDLTLRSYTSLDFAGTQDWSRRDASTGDATVVKQNLTLDAPQLRGVTSADGTAAATDISARAIVLRNTTGRTVGTAATGNGQLTLQALPLLGYGSTGGLIVDAGDQALGFDSAALRSQGDLVLRGHGSLTSQGDLSLAAARVTAGTGAEQVITAAGALRVSSAAGSRTLGERVGSGASVTLAGATLAQEGRIELPGGQLNLQATGGLADDANLRFGAGSVTSVAAFTLDAGNGHVSDGAAGGISASTATGRIELLGTLDVSAARRSDGSMGTGDAGRVLLQASGEGGGLVLTGATADGSSAAGRLIGLAGSAAADLGGQLSVDVARLASADALATASGAGGFTGAWALRVRQGDVTLDTGLAAARIAIAADAGALRVGGQNGSLRLDARAESGGSVQLAAGGDLSLGSGVTLLAGASRTGLTGGDVLLASDLGRISIDAGALVDAQDSAGQGGRVTLRARRSDDDTQVAIAPLNTSRLRAGEVAIEAVRVYEGVDRISSGSSDGSTLGQDSLAADNASFHAQSAGLSAALGITDAEARRVQLRSGVEVRSVGDLSVDADWDLGLNRTGSEAGVLTLRTAGNLRINASISDGFSDTSRSAALSASGPAWSLRLVAGADLAAASPSETRQLSAGADDTGSLLIGASARVRTGAGSIDLAAGRDIRFLGAGDGTLGQVYVAGRGLSGTEQPAEGLFDAMPATPTLTRQGGNLTLTARGNIESAESSQLINNWYWRSGLLETTDTCAACYVPGLQMAWWNQLDRFGQTLGAFGGGNLSIRAGGNVTNVQAFTPTAGYADSINADLASIVTLGGGALSVEAGGNIVGGQFLLGGGTGRLRADGGISAATGNLAIAAPVLALNAGLWRLSGRTGIDTMLPFSPTATPGTLDEGRNSLSPFFYTWGTGSALEAVSNAGTVKASGGPAEGQVAQLGLDTAVNASSAFGVTVSNLRLLAAGGSVSLAGGEGQATGLMFPSATGQLDLYATQDVAINGVQGARFAMSGATVATFRDAAHPFDPNDNSLVNAVIPGSVDGTLALTSLHAGDTSPVRIHADEALRIGGAARNATTLLLPKPAQLSAGTDIVALSVRAQNLEAGDTTTIAAGRNLSALQFGSIELVGPGSLSISAGANLDLGSSSGVTTSGNLRNAALPAAGASVSLQAATAGTLNLATLQASYLTDASADGASGSARAAGYRQALLDYVRTQLKQPALDYDAAWALFQGFPATAQAAFGQQLLASEFSATYLTGGVPTAAQMTATLRATFERDRAQLLAAARAALAGGSVLVMPGVSASADVATAFAALPTTAREGLSSDNMVAATDVRYQTALQRYMASLSALSFDSLDLTSAVSARLASLAQVQAGWKASAAAQAGATVAQLEALLTTQPQDARAIAYRQALADTGSARFLAYRSQVLAAEIASVGAVSSQYGAALMPIRNAFYEQGFQVAELAGVGTAIDQAAWQTAAPLLRYSGALDMTQSSVVTQRGGDIRLVNPGGAITVGLKEADAATKATAKGVIALGGGDIFGFARDDFQVNTQRVFIVGQGDMSIWSSTGDIDSGRGANTAVAAPALTARRSVDGVVFETPATTTGSGLGILEDASGRRSGTIGLYPAFGEILALDAFIRAPSVVLGSSIKGADNLQSATVSGASAAVAAPTLSVSAPASTATETRQADAAAAAAGAESRPRNALLTVDLLGLGPAEPENCSEELRRAGKCPPPVGATGPAPAPSADQPAPAGKPACTPVDQAAGRCR